MKYGVIPINVGAGSLEHLVGVATHAEFLDFESVWTFEHVVIPTSQSSSYPYSADGSFGMTPETSFIDPFIALTAIAASTSRLRLGTGINILPQANPLYLAKQAASLDVLSNGRFIFGLGVGWLREEFRALNASFADRGAVFDEYLGAMKQLWSGYEVSYKGQFLDLQGLKSFPVPNNLPIVIGGMHRKTFTRIARFAHGWFAPVQGPAQLEEFLPLLRNALEKENRDLSEIEISTFWDGRDGDVAAAYARLGVHRLLAPLPQSTLDDQVAWLNKVAVDIKHLE